MSTRPGYPVSRGQKQEWRFHETFFVLAFARDLPRAHRAQSQGPRTGRRGKGAQREAAYRAVNPMMALPALIDGEGPILFESLAIIEYLDDETHPNPPLLPRACAGLAQIVACDSHPLIVPRVREYLEHEFKLDEPTRIKWCQHWHTAALTALEAHLKHAATGAIATATRSRSPTSASRAKPREQNSSRSTPRRFRISPGSLIRSQRSTPSPARTR